MCKVENNEKNTVEVKKAGEETKLENMETATVAECMAGTSVEKAEAAAAPDSLQAIGQVPVPGSGSGTGTSTGKGKSKGTTVKK